MRNHETFGTTPGTRWRCRPIIALEPDAEHRGATFAGESGWGGGEASTDSMPLLVALREVGRDGCLGRLVRL
jgi:hypothetical protein